MAICYANNVSLAHSIWAGHLHGRYAGLEIEGKIHRFQAITSYIQADIRICYVKCVIMYDSTTSRNSEESDAE